MKIFASSAVANISALAVLSTLLLGASAEAEVRKWKDKTGREIEAELVSTSATSVTFKMPNGQLATVEKARLSDEDIDFLKKTPAVAPAVTVRENKDSQPAFSQAVIDTKKWVKTSRPNSLGITGYDFDTQIQTPHFYVTAAKKVRDTHTSTYAECGERLFYQISQHMPGFAKAFEGKRMAIWLTPSTEEHVKVGAALAPLGRTNLNWEDSSSCWFVFSPQVSSEQGLMSGSRAFRTDSSPTFQGNLKWTTRIHFLTSTLCDYCIPSYLGSNASTSMFDLCYSYYLEKLICGKIESKVRFEDDAASIEGFDKGWETAVKRLIAKAGKRPSIDKFTTQQGSDAEPIDLGFGYGLMKYIFTDAGRTAKFNEMLDKCRTERRTPEAADYGTALGEGSAITLDEKWVEYLKSPAF